MTVPGAPGASRGQPAFDGAAMDAVAAARGAPRHPLPPPGYEPLPLTAEEREEARRAEHQRDPVCGLCAGYHYGPSTTACPRLASFELGTDGTLRSGTFFAGLKWAKGRVVFKADTLEKEEAG